MIRVNMLARVLYYGVCYNLLQDVPEKKTVYVINI